MDLAEAIDNGYEMARKARPAGVEITLKDAIWELLMEATQTLKRLPDKEIGFLRSAERSHMPDILRDQEEYFAEEVERIKAGQGPSKTKVHLGPPSKHAIDRMDIVLAWYHLCGGCRPTDRVAMQTLFLRASGVRPKRVAEMTGAAGAKHYRNTVASRKDNALADIEIYIQSKLRAAA